MHTKATRSRHRIPTCLYCALVSMVLMVGCTGHQSPERVTMRLYDGLYDGLLGYRSSSDKVIELITNDTVSINVESFNGDVIIRGDERRENAIVRISRQALHGYGRLDESKESLEQIDYSIALRPGELGDHVIDIRTWTEHPEDHYQRAHIEIDAPALDKVDVRTSNGKVLITNSRGGVQAHTSYGDIRMMTPWPLVQNVVLVNKEGDIDFRVRGESDAMIDAETIGGMVRQRCEWGSWRMIDSRNGEDRLVAQLNEGRHDVLLRTVEGDIRVSIVPDPTNVGTMIIDP